MKRTNVIRQTHEAAIRVFCAAAILALAATGCSAPKYKAPARHTGSGATWTFFRGNATGAAGVADDVVKPPLAPMWTFKAGGPLRSSPVAADGMVVAASQDGNVYGVDQETGKEKWRFKTGDSVLASPLILDGYVYIGSMDHKMYRISLKTGENMLGPATKDFKTNKMIQPGYEVSRGIKGGAATDGNLIFFGALDKKFHAVSKDKLEPVWMYQDIKDWIEAAPVVVNGVVYAGSNDGKLYAFVASTGELMWAFETGNCVYSTPAVVNGVVYFSSWDGNIYAIGAGDGSLKWRTKIDDQVSASPAVAGGKVFVGGAFTEGSLAALDASDGKILWKLKTQGGFDAGPVVSGGVVYVGSYDNYMYAVDSESGKVLWKNLMKNWVRGSAAIANNTVFVGDGNGKLTAFVTAAK